MEYEPKTGPLVSVIMPFLNMQEFLREAVESVMSQTYPRWELFLVDDGSSDLSTSMARDFASLYPGKIHYLDHDSHRNLGASASRNLGLRFAKGDYVALLDADDVWLPSKLSEQVCLLSNIPEADILYGRTLYWYSWNIKKETDQEDFIMELGIPTGKLYKAPVLFPRFFTIADITTPCTCSIIVRRSLIDRIGGFEDKFATIFTDQALYAKLFLYGSAYAAESVWDRYRQHSNSCCAQVEESGSLRAEKIRFLEWLGKYLSSENIKGDMARQVKLALWAERYPILFVVRKSIIHHINNMRIFLYRTKRLIRMA